MNRLIVVLFALVLLLAFLSGCDDKPKDDCEGKDAPALGSSSSATGKDANSGTKAGAGANAKTTAKNK